MTKARELANFARGLPAVFALRSELVAWVAANPAPPVGTVLTAGGLQYEYTGAGGLPGLSGWASFGRASPAHYAISGDVLIPTHFPTLQAVFDTFGPNISENIRVNIEAGHALTAGFRVSNGDYSNYFITSDDASVFVSPSMTMVSNLDLSLDVPRSSRVAFLAVRAKMPTWGILVDMTGVECVTGYELSWSSSGVVRPFCGVINAASPTNGVNARITTASRISAAQSIWTGGANGCVAVTLSSQANFQDADMSGSLGVNACLDVSRGSIVHAKDANCSGGVERGIYVRRSIVFCQSVNVGGNLTALWASLGSTISAAGAVFDGAGTDVLCSGGSSVHLGRAMKDGLPLDPAHSVVSRSTSGTVALKNFNMPGGWGIITYENATQSAVEFLTASSGTILTSVGSLTGIDSLSYATALDLSGPQIIRGGVIFGGDVGIRITIDGVVVLTDASRAVGRDSSGDFISVLAIPPCYCKSSILIEVYNRASVTRDIGFKVYRQSGA